MRRLRATALLVALLSAVFLPSAAWAAAASAKTPGNASVVVVLAPYVTWEDVTPQATPALWELAEHGAVGDVNAHSRDREAGEPASPLEGALSISSGAWAIPAYSAAAAYNVDEPFEVGTAAEAFRRLTGEKVGSNRIVFLGMPVNIRTNEELSFNAVLGTLGQAVEDAGGVTAAVGNSDVGYVTGETRRVRPAALAAMNAQGLVALGDVSTRLLREDPNAPFGIETNLVAFGDALDDVAERTAKAKGPSLIVLDAGDAYRATKFEAQVTEKIAERQRARALDSLDSVVTMARERFPEATLIVAAQALADPLANRREGLGPIVVSGDGWHGFLTSSSTQRTGIVTNLDVTATVLDIMRVERPVSVLGNEMHKVGAPATLAQRVATLQRMNNTAMAVDEGRAGVVNTFVVLTVVVLVLSGFMLVRSRLWTQRAKRWWLAGLRLTLLLVLAVPVSSWLMFVWMPWPQTAGQAVAGLVATMLCVWGLSVALLRFAPFRVPVGAISLLTCAVLIVDQWFGAPASFTNFFGYSPLLGWRFYGMGNEAAAMLFGASVVGMALLFDQWPDAGWVKAAKRFGLPLYALVAIVTVASPFFGANVGVAVWGTVGFVLAWVLMNDRHVSVKTVMWMAVAVAVTVGAFAVIDLFGSGQQTHLGRALTSAESGGVVELWNIVVRKAETNMRVLTSTRWMYILIAVIAFLALMRLRPQGDFADTLGVNPDFADAITVSLIAGIVAYFTEDSGIVIPALEVFYVGVSLAWLMLARVGHRDIPEGES